MPNPSRDEHGDMKAGILAEYKVAVEAGDTKQAAYIAKVLKNEYDHDVEPKKKPARKAAAKKAAPERADAKRPPEDTAEPKPKHKS